MHAGLGGDLESVYLICSGSMLLSNLLCKKFLEKLVLLFDATRSVQTPSITITDIIKHTCSLPYRP